MIQPSFFIAFGVGFLSFLAPCTLPVLPGYFSYLAGVSHKENGKQKRFRIFVTSLSFVLGFLLVLVTLGATASVAGQFLLKNKRLWQKVGGLIVFLFGLQIMGVLKWSFFERSKTLDLTKLVPWQKGKAFFTGASFGLGWTPCVGPVLGSILVLAAQTKTLGQGMGLLVAYTLGLAIPLLFSGFFLAQLKFLRGQYARLISGMTLAILGILLFFNQYSKLTTGLARFYQVLKIPIF